jgi:beta-glucosidase
VHCTRACFERFGDRIKQWVTFNEPYIISIFGHINGTLAPGHRAIDGYDTKHELWLVGHTLIASHAAVAKMYCSEFEPKQNGRFSIVLNSHFYEPCSDSPVDIQAAATRLEFFVSWLGDPFSSERIILHL